MVWRVQKRMGMEAALRAANALFIVGTLAVALPALVLAWFRPNQQTAAAVSTLLLITIALSALLAIVVGRRAARKAEAAAAELLDHCHGLHGLVRSTCEFAHKRPEQRTAFELACVQRAEEKATSWRPEHVHSLTRALWTSLPMLMLFAATSVAAMTLSRAPSSWVREFNQVRNKPSSSSKRVPALANRAYLAEELRRIAADLQSSESPTRDLAGEIARIADEVRAGRNDEAELLVALENFERHAKSLEDLDAAAWQQGIHSLAAEHLTAEQVTRRLARAQAALQAKKSAAAQDAMDAAIRQLESLARMQRDKQAANKAARGLAQLRQEVLRSPQPPSHGSRAPAAQQQFTMAKLGAEKSVQTQQLKGNQSGGTMPGGLHMRPRDAEGGPPSSEPGAPLLSADASGSVVPSGPATKVEGQTGAGPSRRQIIAAATSSGFATAGYEKVHAEYLEYERQSMEDAPLSTSDRFAIERYFRLIRPAPGAP